MHAFGVAQSHGDEEEVDDYAGNSNKEKQIGSLTWSLLRVAVLLQGEDSGGGDCGR